MQVNALGLLTGATSVDVNGVLYDVAFKKGTCAQVYGTCSNDFFAFHDSMSALAASNALLDQVFIDSNLGLFDTIPGNTIGILPFSPYSFTLTPYSNDGTIISTYSTINRQDIYPNIHTDDMIYAHAFPDSVSIGPNYGAEHFWNWALWTTSQPPKAPEVVSEPSILLLLSTGLLTLVVSRRRNCSV